MASSKTVLCVWYYELTTVGAQSIEITGGTATAGSTMDTEGGSLAYTGWSTFGTPVTATNDAVTVESTSSDNLVVAFFAAGNTISDARPLPRLASPSTRWAETAATSATSFTVSAPGGFTE